MVLAAFAIAMAEDWSTKNEVEREEEMYNGMWLVTVNRKFQLARVVKVRGSLIYASCCCGYRVSRSVECSRPHLSNVFRLPRGSTFSESQDRRWPCRSDDLCHSDRGLSGGSDE